MPGLALPNLLAGRYALPPHKNVTLAVENILVGLPETWWPAESDVKAKEVDQRLDFWASYMLWCFGMTVMVGTLLMVKLVPCWDLSELRMPSPWRELSSVVYFLCACPCYRLSIVLFTYLGLLEYLVFWSAATGRLSTRTGLDWEAYAILLTLGCVWLLHQAAVLGPVSMMESKRSEGFRRLGEEDEEEPPTDLRFGVDEFLFSSLSVLPFMSDTTDTMKDAIFAGICFCNADVGVKILGGISTAHLWGLHLYLLRSAEERANLEKAYLAVLTANRKAGVGGYKPSVSDKVVAVFYKQCLPSRQRALLLEDAFQGLLAVVYALLATQSSLFVLVGNIAVPLLRFLFARAAHGPLRRRARRWILQQCALNGSPMLRSSLAVEVVRLLQEEREQQVVPRGPGDEGLVADADWWREALQGPPATFAVRGLRAALELVSEAPASLDLASMQLYDEGIRAVAAAVEKNDTVISLNISRNGLSEEGGCALAEALAENRTLTFLDLDMNHIRDKGAGALAWALESGASLHAVQLFGNQITKVGARALAAALESGSSLTSLKLSSNRIGDDGGCAVAGALEKNRTLEDLSLRGNDLSDVFGLRLAAALGTNATLTSIDLGFNELSDKSGEALLQQATEHGSALSVLDLRDNRLSKDVLDAVEKALVRVPAEALLQQG